MTVQILCPPSSHEFLATLASGDIYLDSFPFGGCSSIVDALLVNQPIVSLSGTKYSNRCGPHLLETADLHQMIAYDQRAYFLTAVRLLSDDDYRNSLTRRMEQERNWSHLFFASSNQRENDYTLGFRYLFSMHDELKSRGGNDPLRIPELCSRGEYERGCQV